MAYPRYQIASRDAKLKPPATLWHFASQLLWPVLFLPALLTERG
mgnify:CR=1 FL=1